jgi:hypothetical protein
MLLQKNKIKNKKGLCQMLAFEKCLLVLIFGKGHLGKLAQNEGKCLL